LEKRFSSRKFRNLIGNFIFQSEFSNSGRSFRFPICFSDFRRNRCFPGPNALSVVNISKIRLGVIKIDLSKNRSGIRCCRPAICAASRLRPEFRRFVTFIYSDMKTVRVESARSYLVFCK
jgi:hypothetical protein